MATHLVKHRYDCFPLRDVAVDPSLTFAELSKYLFLLVHASAVSCSLGYPNPPSPHPRALGGAKGPPQGPRGPSGPLGADGASRRPRALVWFILRDVLHGRGEDEER